MKCTEKMKKKEKKDLYIYMKCTGKMKKKKKIETHQNFNYHTTNTIKKSRLEESNNDDFSSLHLLPKAIESPATFERQVYPTWVTVGGDVFGIIVFVSSRYF
jgi:hypothetical protein